MDLAEIIGRHADREGPLLPILHDVQAEAGHIGEDAISTIALALNLTRAEVHGVVSFYHDFLSVPEPRPVLQLCRAEACQARGVEALVADIEAAAGDRVKVATIYCLGLCSVGPAAMAGNRVYGRLTSESARALVASL